jgi:hypothetical protein
MMKTHPFTKSVLLVLVCFVALTTTASVSAENQLELRGKHQFGVGLGGVDFALGRLWQTSGFAGMKANS